MLSPTLREAPGAKPLADVETRVRALASIPATPGVVVSDFVFGVSAGMPCGSAAGPGTGALPNAANLGISYDPNQFPELNEAAFVIMRLDANNQWVPVGSIPDPSNDYVSATITETGIYAVVAQ